MAQALRRKLTTIVSADVAGYSRLMDDDEVATVETLKAYRGAIEGFVERHAGRLVSTAGDGLLAEFDSIVEAVQCAAEVQRELGARNSQVAEARRMAFRIGINLGDVIVEDGDIYGEGVNVAARLQGLAEPGGICISGTVFDQVRNKLTLGYDFLGAQAVKNIAEPVPTYRVLLDGATEAAAAPDRGAPANTASAAGDKSAAMHSFRAEAAAHSFRAEAAAAPDRGAPANTANAASDKSAAMRSFRRQASRFGIILGLLFIVNLIDDPGDLWVVWPALGLGTVLAFSALRTFGDGDDGGSGNASRSMRKYKTRLGQVKGDLFVTENTRMLGQIGGNAAVASGVSLKLLGQIDGDLTIEPGARASVIGQITGDVLNHGGILRHIGHLVGTEKQVAPEESGGPGHTGGDA